MFETGLIDDFQLGKLLNNHQDNLRDSKKRVFKFDENTERPLVIGVSFFVIRQQ